MRIRWRNCAVFLPIWANFAVFVPDGQTGFATKTRLTMFRPWKQRVGLKPLQVHDHRQGARLHWRDEVRENKGGGGGGEQGNRYGRLNLGNLLIFLSSAHIACTLNIFNKCMI